jgi:hypothetical protein
LRLKAIIFTVAILAIAAFVFRPRSAPRSADDAMNLVQVDVGTSAVEKAARLGIPFRVALPTYGYRVFLGVDGKVIAVQAEGPEPSVPRAKVTEVRASPAEMAGLVRQWTASRPAALAGTAIPHEYARQAWLALIWTAFDGRSRFAFDFP